MQPPALAYTGHGTQSIQGHGHGGGHGHGHTGSLPAVGSAESALNEKATPVSKTVSGAGAGNTVEGITGGDGLEGVEVLYGRPDIKSILEEEVDLALLSRGGTSGSSASAIPKISVIGTSPFLFPTVILISHVTDERYHDDFRSFRPTRTNHLHAPSDVKPEE